MVIDMYLKRLKELREEKQKLQKDIAQVLNMKQQQYQRYENGTNEISLTLIKILADYYNTSIDYLVERTNEKKPYPKIK